MRTQNLWRIISLASLAGVVSLWACGDDSSSKQDLEVAKDMSAPTMGINCYTALLCAAECTSPTCISTCVSMATPAAQATFGAIEACGLQACTVVPDGGSTADGGGAACASTTDTSAGCVACAWATAESSVCATQIAACEDSYP